MSEDRITIRGMQFLARHGVRLEERLEHQPFEVDVDLVGDVADAAASDDLARTVDYAAVYVLVQEVVEGRSFRLIEALAAAIAEAVLSATDTREVTVRVRKPKAPLPGPFETVQVEITRARPG